MCIRPSQWVSFRRNVTDPMCLPDSRTRPITQDLRILVLSAVAAALLPAASAFDPTPATSTIDPRPEAQPYTKWTFKDGAENLVIFPPTGWKTSAEGQLCSFSHEDWPSARVDLSVDESVGPSFQLDEDSIKQITERVRGLLPKDATNVDLQGPLNALVNYPDADGREFIISYQLAGEELRKSVFITLRKGKLYYFITTATGAQFAEFHEAARRFIFDVTWEEANATAPSPAATAPAPAVPEAP